MGYFYKKEAISKTYKHKQGYRRIHLKDKKYLIHRLVCNLFCENIENKNIVNHIDSNPSNNFYKNLEWCTSKENSLHSIKSGRDNNIFKGNFGLDHPYSKPILQIDYDGNIINKYACLEEPRRLGINFTPSSIWKVCNGVRKTHKGYIWKYA